MDSTPLSFNIAIVGGCLSSHGGGAPRSIAQQAKSLKKGGQKVTIFAGCSEKYPFTPDELGLQNLSTRISPLWGPSVLGLFPGALLKLWKEAKQFDLIHLNGAWNLTTFLGALIARSRKTPYIISCRSHYGDYHFSRLAPLKKILFQLLEKLSIRHAYALHVTADWEEKTSWRAVQVSKRVIKIANPVDLSDFKNPPQPHEARRELGLDSDAFYLVHLGRLGAQKNLPLLLKAFHQAQLPSSARLVLIGPPEKAVKKILQHLAAELNLTKQIQFINFAKGRERCIWLAAANLFTLPSNDENFCIAAIEAAASGTVSLLSPQVGAVEYMPENLVKVLPNEVTAWSDELKKRSQSAPLEHGRNRDWLNQFSQETITAHWIEVYAQLKRR